MSTVLEAVRERDGRGASSAPEPLAGLVHHRPRWLWPAIGLGLASVALLPAVRVSWLTRVSEAPLPAPVATPLPIGKAAEPVTPVVQPPPTVPLGEAPRARVGPWARNEPPAPAPPAPTAPAVVPALREEVAPAAAGAIPTPGPEPAGSPPATPAVTAARPVVPMGTRAVHLESIRYGGGPAERAATLVIDGATPVTLRQGESAGDVEVQLVLPQAVYVRRGTEVFALGELR